MRAVILFDTAANNTTELALERLIFTVVGALFAIALAAAINLFTISEDNDKDGATGSSNS